jgi:hypothetical protein
MIKLLALVGSGILGVSSIILLAKYVTGFNHFLRVFKTTHEDKWNELGSLERLGFGFKNKRARAQIHRWMKKETDVKYYDLQRLYLRVSRTESIAAILIVLMVGLLLLNRVLLDNNL